MVGIGHTLLVGGRLIFFRHHIPVFVNGYPVQELSAVFQQIHIPVQIGEGGSG